MLQNNAVIMLDRFNACMLCDLDGSGLHQKYLEEEVVGDILPDTIFTGRSFFPHR